MVVYTSPDGMFRVVERNGLFFPEYWNDETGSWSPMFDRITSLPIVCGSLDDAKVYEGRK